MKAILITLSLPVLVLAAIGVSTAAAVLPGELLRREREWLERREARLRQEGHRATRAA